MTYQDLVELYLDAQEGDIFAEDTLRKEIRREAKRANRQILRMEKSVVKSESFYRAKDYLKTTGRRTFRERTATGNLDDLMKEAESIAQFTNASDYRFGKKEQERLSKYSDVLEKTFNLDTDEQKNKMAEFLSSSAWEDYKKVRYVRGSGTLNDISDLFKSGTDINELLEAFGQWQQGGLDIIELEEIWKK